MGYKIKIKSAAKAIQTKEFMWWYDIITWLYRSNNVWNFGKLPYYFL